jgi:hypothetical protein
MGTSESMHAAQQAALRGKPIEKEGLKLWAITMSRYEEWTKCRNVWTARQSRFPVSCISLPFLEALFEMDMQAIDQTGNPKGYVYSILYGLGMALRMKEDCVRSGDIYLAIDEEKRKFNAIRIKRTDGSETEITAAQFDVIRRTVLWMNGEDVPDESENDELLEAERDLAERNAPRLKYDLIDLEASVALAYRTRISDVMEWSILEFEACRRAVQRDRKHLICGIGETNGCKWESGNPYPSWCFDKLNEGSGALISQDQFGRQKTNKKE